MEVLNKFHFSLQMVNCPIPVAEHSGLRKIFHSIIIFIILLSSSPSMEYPVTTQYPLRSLVNNVVNSSVKPPMTSQNLNNCSKNLNETETFLSNRRNLRENTRYQSVEPSLSVAPRYVQAKLFDD